MTCHSMMDSTTISNEFLRGCGRNRKKGFQSLVREQNRQKCSHLCLHPDFTPDSPRPLPQNCFSRYVQWPRAVPASTPALLRSVTTVLWAVTDMHGLAAMGDRSSWKLSIKAGQQV